MASRLSSDHPESLHLYHADRSRSTTSLESQGRRRGFLSRFLLSSRKEGLLPLPEGARLSLLSPPPLLLRIPHTPLDLPHPASMPITERMAGDSTWAATYESPPLPPTTILGMPILQHPQPQSAQASSGITSLSHTASTSQRPTMVHPSTEPLPQSQHTRSTEEHPMSGINPSRPPSGHPSLYEKSRNPSPVPQPSTPQAATGPTSTSSVHHFEPAVTEDVGDESTDSSDRSHNLHQSYWCPLSHTMSTELMRQPARALSTSFTDLPRHSPTRLPTPTEYQSPVSRPPSHRSRVPTPAPLPAMTLADAIQFYLRTATDLSIAIPNELKQAEYRELYNYYAYELPFILAWGETQARNDYFMKRNRGLLADDILQYEAEWNARLLYNEIHRNVPMEPMAPYEEVIVEADIQDPMPDSPPVPPPRAPVTTFSYIRGHKPPGTFSTGYKPFGGAGSSLGGESRQPGQPP